MCECFKTSSPQHKKFPIFPTLRSEYFHVEEDSLRGCLAAAAAHYSSNFMTCLTLKVILIKKCDVFSPHYCLKTGTENTLSTQHLFLLAQVFRIC